ncbi:non-heme iron oxygenase ferredoxin subunit [Phenylobacterium sp.]|uniref:non-heme iron oxygenase ferredoxin subunit n=1 Tax=Phenylobacterium sp. TaxID=1871053 RepID=UPI0025F4D75B|nr:non-heme iron oxygenase ferredoxin subunit [Phenylobacterium sp.]
MRRAHDEALAVSVHDEAPEGMTRLIGADEVREGDVRKVRLAGVEPIAVCRIDGGYFATQDGCSHAKASLSEGWIEGHDICCPVHDGRFDVRDGRPMCFPATDPIRTFPVQVIDGTVFADLRGARTDQEVSA